MLVLWICVLHLIKNDQYTKILYSLIFHMADNTFTLFFWIYYREVNRLPRTCCSKFVYTRWFFSLPRRLIAIYIEYMAKIPILINMSTWLVKQRILFFNVWNFKTTKIMFVNRYLPFSDEYRSVTVTNGSSQKLIFLKKGSIIWPLKKIGYWIF